MKKLALFAGTTEGKILAEKLAALSGRADCADAEAAGGAGCGCAKAEEETGCGAGKTAEAADGSRPEPTCGSRAAFRADVFVATEYGKEGLPDTAAVSVFCGRLTEPQMERRFSEETYDLVIDATHPYAAEVTKNLQAACESCQILYWRVLRETDGEKTKGSGSGNAAAGSGQSSIYRAADLTAALDFLKHTDGNIFVTTGSKELARFRELSGWEERVYARVLSLPEVVQTCGALGFHGRHLIAMQGPFSRELNAAMLKGVNAKWLVTKESGRAGGYQEKAAAAAETGVGLVVIGRPEETGISVGEAAARLERFLEAETNEAAVINRIEKTEKTRGAMKAENVTAARQTAAQPGRIFWLVGAGPGNPELLTGEAKRAFSECELLAGARRNVEQLRPFGKPSLSEYTAEKILAYLREHPEYRRIAVALSGDPGFYSGAKKLAEAFGALPDTGVRILPGISSMNYFFARLGKSWENVRLLSFHGQDAEMEKELRTHAAVFLLAGGRDALKIISGRLLEAGLADVRMTVGENLSLPAERIETGTPETFAEREAESLSVVLLERGAEAEPEAEAQSGTDAEAEEKILTSGLEDEEFLRGEVPMTKQEVRAVALAKLRLVRGAVVWDIGAGTGSVSVECARLSGTVQVYAVEKKPEAVELLFRNRAKFGLSNLEIIAGTAPEALAGLPAPTHVFIGGSGGNMRGLLLAALQKSPAVRFVITAIMPETLAEILRCRKELAASAEYPTAGKDENAEKETGAAAGEPPVREENRDIPAGRAYRLTEPDIVQLTAARARKVGPGHLMMGQNPVWIVSFSTF